MDRNEQVPTFQGLAAAIAILATGIVIATGAIDLAEYLLG